MSDTVSFGSYVVALLDILGQKAELRSLTDLPLNEKERAEFIKKIKRTFGVVDGTRKWFQDFYQAFGESAVPPANLPSDRKDVFEKLSATRLRTQGFGDTIVLFASLADAQEHMPMNSMYAALVASGSTMLTSLAAQHPLRGAIEVGIGAEMYEGEIYGSCLSNAFELESYVAGYPRVVVGPQAIAYLMNKRNNNESDFESVFNKKLADSCLSMLTQDIDGYAIVDYLGKGFTKIVKDASLQDDLIPKAFSFVEGQCKEWSKAKDSKLAIRYNTLRQYFIARMSE